VGVDYPTEPESSVSLACCDRLVHAALARDRPFIKEAKPGPRDALHCNGLWSEHRYSVAGDGSSKTIGEPQSPFRVSTSL
jgi:hypothetical protein